MIHVSKDVAIFYYNTPVVDQERFFLILLPNNSMKLQFDLIKKGEGRTPWIKLRLLWILHCVIAIIIIHIVSCLKYLSYILLVRSSAIYRTSTSANVISSYLDIECNDKCDVWREANIEYMYIYIFVPPFMENISKSNCAHFHIFLLKE